jgi:hypothetical protein
MGQSAKVAPVVFRDYIGWWVLINHIKFKTWEPSIQFLFLVCLDDSFRPTETLGAETDRWVEVIDKGKFRVLGDRLVAPQDAVTVKIRNGKTDIMNGPFETTKAQIAGFDLINCAGKEETIQIALKHPMAKLGTIEIRQFWTE